MLPPVGDPRSTMRSALKSVPGLRAAAVQGSLTSKRVLAAVSGRSFERLGAVDVVRFAYEVLLAREPDEQALEHYVPAIALGHLTPRELVDRLRLSDEFRVRTAISASSLHSSLHASRCEFIIGLPPARRIIDLGGSHRTHPWGALVIMGYPYPFESRTVVDLPPEDRHPLYESESWSAVVTPHGPIRYEFRSMTDLSFAADDSIDLVYSGQSIEHVTPEDGDVTLREVLRVLRPGGVLALDTPNGTMCRLLSEEFIDPDHEVEYSAGELQTKLEAAGFVGLHVRGLNYCGDAPATGVLDEGFVASHPGVYSHAESCFLLAVVAMKPHEPPARSD
jgi:SAM-dependent methyltransferase